MHCIFAVWLTNVHSWGRIVEVMKAVNSIPATQFDMRKSVEVQVGGDFAVYLPSGVYEIKKMEPRKRLRSIAFVCLLLAVAGIIGFGYFCPDQVGIICRNVLSIRFLIDQMFFDYFFFVWYSIEGLCVEQTWVASGRRMECHNQFIYE